MDDPEAFLDGLSGRRVVLDEIHRLTRPSELLKIAADHYPGTRLIATGSSTLGASKKFSDTLAGRKAELWLTPMISADLDDFGSSDLSHRFLRGGLPPFFMAKTLPERDFQEWIDAYWAKDIQELFRLERRQSFQRFAELLMVQSGGIFEATRFAGQCEVSRTTIANYLAVLEATFVVHVVRPYSTKAASEIVSAPKVYAFDTGFVSYHRGWYTLRDDDLGPLWEHFVLNEIQARLQTRRVHYWRDKRGHEVDFVLLRRRSGGLTAIECKWRASHPVPKGLLSFCRRYPTAESYVVASDVDQPFKRRVGKTEVTFIGLSGLIDRLLASELAASG
jgi:predicted AAA+ superfamily ATPase